MAEMLHQQKTDAEREQRLAEIRRVGALLRSQREAVIKSGSLWRDDAQVMSTVRQLLVLKYQEEETRHECTVDPADPTITIKVRWRVALPRSKENEGKRHKLVTLQRPFANKAVLTVQEIHEAVQAMMKKKYPQCSDVTSVVLEDGSEFDSVSPNVEFPGPKFSPVSLIRCLVFNREFTDYQAETEKRRESHQVLLELAKAKKAAELESKAAEKLKRQEANAANAAAGVVPNRRGRGRRGRGRGKGRGRN